MSDRALAHYEALLDEVRRPHLHHYVDGVCADSRAPGGPCGESQRYNPPTGQGRDPFVIVDEGDLRSLIGAYRDQAAMTDEGALALCDRLETLLSEA